VITRLVEEIGGLDSPLAGRAGDAEHGVERDQGRRRIRRVDDVTGSASENRVKLVLARHRKTLVSARLEAREPVAVVPAPRALTQVARQRADVSDLWRRHALGRLGEHRVLTPDGGFATQRIERDHSPDRKPAAFRRHAIESLDPFQADDDVR